MHTVDKKTLARASAACNANDRRVKLKNVLDMPGHLLRRAQQVNGAIFAEEIGEAELTSVQYAALVAIRDYPGTDATMLSGLIFFDRATIGGVLERLVAKKLIDRRESPVDRRVKELNITTAGINLLDNIALSVRKVQERLMAPFTPVEKAVFLDLLRKLIDGSGSGSTSLLKAEPRSERPTPKPARNK
jgi:DNA-binding MarR family transcriptional regulator